ncbi:MAG: DUF2804 domain-containing protein [Burkholderiales bacterium]|nr:DUF2804 domain-containing protein [Burkholderiales bacterium]
MPVHFLPAAPAALVDDQGRVHFGQYAGHPAQIDWSGLPPALRRSRLWRHFHHKRWQYVALASEEVFCGIAIVDVGWTNTAFAYAFDRRQRKLVAGFSQDGLPGLSARLDARPAAGAASHFRLLGKRIDYRQVPDSRLYRLAVQCGDFKIAAEFDAQQAPPCLLAVGAVDGGGVHATVKSSAMPVRGSVSAGARVYDLDGGVASFDHSNGFLARDTAWRWASAHSAELGFNLQAGYFGNHENALWLDGRLIALGAAHFDFDPAAPLAPWHIYTADGLLDLQFQPEGCRAENKNLLVAASRYVQPIGSFSGWVKASADARPRRVEQLVGVTEDHRSRW